MINMNAVPLCSSCFNDLHRPGLSIVSQGNNVEGNCVQRSENVSVFLLGNTDTRMFFSCENAYLKGLKLP